MLDLALFVAGAVSVAAASKLWSMREVRRHTARLGRRNEPLLSGGVPTGTTRAVVTIRDATGPALPLQVCRAYRRGTTPECS